MKILRKSLPLIVTLALSGPIWGVSISRVSLLDASGQPRQRFSSTERAGMRIEVNVGAAVERINYRFVVLDPSGREVFRHDGNSSPGSKGVHASDLRNLPLAFYTGPGNYLLRGEALVGGAVVSQVRANFSIHSPVISLLYPPNASTDLIDSPIVFRWASSGAARYSVQVSEDEGFFRPIWNGDTTASSMNYPLNPSDERQVLKGGVQYYWRVRGFDASGTRIASSDVFRFKVREESSSDFSRNLGISDIRFNPLLSRFPDDVVFTVEVQNTGTLPEDDTEVQFYLDGREVGRRQIPQILPGGRAELNFNVGRLLEEHLVATAAMDIIDDNSRDNILTRNVVVGLPDEWKGVPKIMGRIVDGQTGRHLRGVTVTLSGPTSRSAVTDPNGRFVFEELPIGTYTIEASMEDYRFEETLTVYVESERAYPLRAISGLPDSVSAEDYETIRVERSYNIETAWEEIRNHLSSSELALLEGYSPVNIEILPDADLSYIIERLRLRRARIRSKRIESR